MFFFFNDTATTEIYTLSRHDALPIFESGAAEHVLVVAGENRASGQSREASTAVLAQVGHAEFEVPLGGTIPAYYADRKSTRLNSSHANISYAVFCLKKKKSMIHSDPH